jgi:bifunctional non-homologous end joining protein LigD
MNHRGKSKMGLEAYNRKRDFKATPEPEGKMADGNKRRFVVQEHHASHLHFDFRLEMGGVLKSWSVPKGPTLDPTRKRLAVETEDHPVEYLKFEGRIPEGHYGAGEQLIWDTGSYETIEGGDPLAQLRDGKLSFQLRGEKLKGEFNLVRLRGRDKQWLLVKSKDRFARPGWSIKLILESDALPKPKKLRPESEKRVRKISKRVGEKMGNKPVAASLAFKAKKLGGDLDLKAQGKIVSLTNLDKVYWPGDGYTKGDFIKYYYEVSKYILPYLKDRPLILKRYPNGIEGASFHQHDVDEVPSFVRTASVKVEEGHTVDYIICDTLPTLLYVANLGAIERHPWHSRTRNLDRPDWIVFDLDPDEGVDYSDVCEAALALKDELANLGLDSYAKTSGSRGMHVYVPVKPVYSYTEVADFAARVATLVAERMPEIATVERSLRKRGRGRIYVDHLQNARGKSVVSPYSVRPRAGATVSAPLDWAEVKRRKVTPRDFTIKNMLRRVEAKGELFKAVLGRKQSLTKAIRMIGANRRDD